MPKSVFIVFLIFVILAVNGAGKSWISQPSEAWDAEWKSGAWNYLESVPIERSRMAVIGGVYIPAYAPLGSILDIGCGEGVLVDYLLHNNTRSNYLGIDISAEAIHRARKLHPDTPFSVYSAHKYIPKTKIAVLLFSEMLYYVNYEQILTRYVPYLLPRGILIISIFLGNNNDRPNHRHQMIVKFSKANFVVIDEILLMGSLKRSADRIDKVKTLVLVLRLKGP